VIDLKTIVLSIIDFLKNPRKMESIAPWSLVTFVHLLVFAYIIVFLFAGLFNFIDIDSFEHKTTEYLSDSWLVLFFLAVFFAPILEELVFRFHLNLKPYAITFGLVFSLFFISSYWILMAMYIIYMIALLLSVYYRYVLSYAGVVYVSSIFFALVHISNYESFDVSRDFVFIPVLIGPQLMLGFILSYIRIHYGLVRAILFHGVYNGLLFIPLVLLNDL
jgi:uncharacterized protein